MADYLFLLKVNLINTFHREVRETLMLPTNIIDIEDEVKLVLEDTRKLYYLFHIGNVTGAKYVDGLLFLSLHTNSALNNYALETLTNKINYSFYDSPISYRSNILPKYYTSSQGYEESILIFRVLSIYKEIKVETELSLSNLNI